MIESFQLLVLEGNMLAGLLLLLKDCIEHVIINMYKKIASGITVSI